MKRKAYGMVELLYTLSLIAVLASIAYVSMKPSKSTSNIVEERNLISKIIKNQENSYISFNDYDSFESSGNGDTTTIKKIISTNSFTYFIPNKYYVKSDPVYCNNECLNKGYLVEIRETTQSKGFLFNSCSMQKIPLNAVSNLDNTYNNTYDNLSTCDSYSYTDTAIDNSNNILSCKTVDSEIEDISDSDRLRIHSTTDLSTECDFDYVTDFDSSKDCSKNTNFKVSVLDTEDIENFTLYGSTDTQNILKITKPLANKANFYYEGSSTKDYVYIENGNRGYIILDLKDSGDIYLNENYNDMYFTTIKYNDSSITSLIFQNKNGGVFKLYNFTNIYWNNGLTINPEGFLSNTNITYQNKCFNNQLLKNSGNTNYSRAIDNGILSGEDISVKDYNYNPDYQQLTDPELSDPVVIIITLLNDIQFPITFNFLNDIEDVTNNFTGDRYAEIDNENYYAERDNLSDIVEVSGNSARIKLEGGDNNVLNVNGNAEKKIYTGEGSYRIDIDGDLDKIPRFDDGNEIVRIGGDSNERINFKKGTDFLQVEGNLEGSIKTKGTLTTYIFGYINDNIDLTKATGPNVTYIEGDLKGKYKGSDYADTLLINGDIKEKITLNAGNNNVKLTGDINDYITASDTGNDRILITKNLNGDLNTDNGDDIVEVIGTVNGSISTENDNDIIILYTTFNNTIDGGNGTDTAYLLNYTLDDYNNNVDDIKSNLVNIENILFKDFLYIGDISALYTIDWN